MNFIKSFSVSEMIIVIQFYLNPTIVRVHDFNHLKFVETCFMAWNVANLNNIAYAL